MSVWRRDSDGLAFDPPHHHETEIRELITKVCVNHKAGTPGSGVCDRLENALSTGRFPRSLIDQFSNWCNTNMDVEPIARKAARCRVLTTGILDCTGDKSPQAVATIGSRRSADSRKRRRIDGGTDRILPRMVEVSRGQAYSMSNTRLGPSSVIRKWLSTSWPSKT